MEVDMSSQRKTALVVGGTRGIGREIARRLVADGFDVTVAGRPSSESAATAAGMGATFLPADVSDPDQVRVLASEF
jgi:NAD(P)-dependent dehydrogenase (short-subunit alcohol dehydrogenase family)